MYIYTCIYIIIYGISALVVYARCHQLTADSHYGSRFRITRLSPHIQPPGCFPRFRRWEVEVEVEVGGWGR